MKLIDTYAQVTTMFGPLTKKRFPVLILMKHYGCHSVMNIIILEENSMIPHVPATTIYTTIEINVILNVILQVIVLQQEIIEIGKNF